jgi:hypothetical protein
VLESLNRWEKIKELTRSYILQSYYSAKQISEILIDHHSFSQFPANSRDPQFKDKPAMFSGVHSVFRTITLNRAACLNIRDDDFVIVFKTLHQIL